MTKAVLLNTTGKYLSRVISLAIGFFFTPYLLGKLGAEVMALQVIAFQILQYSSVVNSSFSTGYFRFATIFHSRNEFGKMNHVLSQGLFLTIVSSLVTIGAVGVIIPFVDKLFGLGPSLANIARFTICFTTVGFIFGIVFEVYTTPLYIKQKLFVVNLGDSAGKLLSSILILVLFVYITPRLEWWVSASVVAGILVQLAVVLPISKRAVPEIVIKLSRPDRGELKGLVGFSLYTLIGSLGYLLYFSSDSVIISNMLGPKAVTLYNIGQRWDPQIRILVLAFTSGLGPMCTRFFSQNNFDELKSTFSESVRLAYLIVLLPSIFLIAYSGPFLALWVGQEYVITSGPVLTLVMGCLALSVSGCVSWEMLVSINQVRSASLATVLLGVVNVVASIFFVHFGMGIFGVAMGSTIALILKDLVVLPWLVLHHLKISFAEYMKHAFPRPILIAVIVMVTAFACRFFLQPSNWLRFILGASVYGIIGASAIFLIGLKRPERLKLLSKLGWRQGVQK